MRIFLEILPIIVGLGILVFGTILLSRYTQLEKDIEVIKKLATKNDKVPNLPKPNLDFIVFGIALIVFAISLIVLGFCAFIFNDLYVIQVGFPTLLGGLALVIFVILGTRKHYKK